jgi:aryl-alcohol dehydrogenase-like predicted oxidoreductase
MEYRNLGSSNLTISRLRLGAMGIGDPSWREWVLDEAASRPIDDAVERVANAHGVLPAQVALAWTVSRPGVIAPIFGPTKF